MQDEQSLLHEIRRHYDLLSSLYFKFWGEHLHHGYFEQCESPAVAQVRLIEHVANRAQVPWGGHVLDVGCGLGGSSRWVAAERRCSVLGITISPVQARVAVELTRQRGLDGLVDYAVMDANHLSYAPESFDAVWVIECSEHLVDKPHFIGSCARMLRPGGRLALCAWLTSDDARRDHALLLRDIRTAMLCPSIGTEREYARWIEEAGLELLASDDLTRAVTPTWEHCAAIGRRPIVWLHALLQGRHARRFVASFEMMRRATACGVLGYGLFVASRPRS